MDNRIMENSRVLIMKMDAVKSNRSAIMVNINATIKD